MRITELKLSNFCGFSDFKISFGALSSLVGPNNGGKTTILRAIRMVFDSVELSIEPYIRQIREWENKGQALDTEAKKEAGNLATMQQQRREVHASQQEGLAPVQAHRNKENLSRNEKQELANLAEAQRKKRERWQNEYPKLQCDLGLLVRRQNAKDARHFFFRHIDTRPASLELRLQSNLGAVKLLLELSSSAQVSLSLELDGNAAQILPPEKRRELLEQLRKLRSLFVQSTGNISPSEQALSWPQLQEQMGHGKEHDVWRNQLHWLCEGRSPEAYQRVIARIQQALGKVRLRPPSRTREQPPNAIVAYEEEGDLYDIAEGGAGLRTLLGVAACIELSEASVLLFDEPDAHLHSAVQRQLAEFLESQASDSRQIIVATHAPDMIEQFSLDALVWIDRSHSEGRACDDTVRTLVDLGAVTRRQALEFAKADALIYFESKPDRRLLESLMRKCGLGEMLEHAQLAELQGCGDIQHLPHVARFLWDHHRKRIPMAVVRDADYTRLGGKLNVEETVLIVALPCKEIENLLLLQPQSLYDSAEKAAERRREFTGGPSSAPTLPEIQKFLDEATQAKEIRDMVENNWIVSRIPEKPDSGHLSKARKEFDSSWADPDFRRRNAPGKAILRMFRKWLQEGWQLAIPSPFEFYTPNAEVTELFKQIETHITGILKQAE